MRCPRSLEDCRIRQRTGAEAACTPQSMGAPVVLDPVHGHSRILQPPVLHLYRSRSHLPRRRRSARLGGALPYKSQLWRPLHRPCCQVKTLGCGDGCQDDGEAVRRHVNASWTSNVHEFERHMHRRCMDFVRKRLLKAACVLIAVGLGTTGGLAFLRDACASHAAFRTRAICRDAWIAAH